MSSKPKDRTDIAAGLLLMATAGFFGWQTLGLEIGTSLRMGPGYFPLVLSILLFILGAVVFAKAFGKEDEPIGKIAWRGLFFILIAPVFFGFTVRGLGFAPALFFTTLIAAQASVRMRPLAAIVLAVAVTVASMLIFSYGLGLPFQRFGPWVRF